MVGLRRIDHPILICESFANNSWNRLGSTYHGAGQNTTSDEYRLLFAGFMTPGWCRQDENQYLAYSFEDIKDYPEDVQKLLGYYVSRPYGGFVEQMEPLEFLKCNGDWTKWKPGDLL